MVIIQNDVGNRHSPIVIVAAISSQISNRPTLPTHYHLGAKNGLLSPSVILLEQLRTIDKQRLEEYIGHLSDAHIWGLNHALSISTGLIRFKPENLILCLCHTCANNFYSTGIYALRRINPIQVKTELCTYCNIRLGYNYEIILRKGKNNE